MSLKIVATPIGNLEDITLRAKNALAECDVVIAEEHRPASTLLKRLGLEQKEIYLLNEHTNKKDLRELVELCRTKQVALISDCGTPNFCDPGADLIKALREQKIPVQSLPGPSSLMMLLSLSSQRLNQFVFVGFLPAEREARKQAIANLKNEKRSQVVFETPYRLSRLLNELAEVMPERKALLALDLTLESEKVMENSIKKLTAEVEGLKAEPVLLIY